MKLISISRILGRQGLIKNFDLSKTKNNVRDDDDFTGNCVCTNMERYYNIHERESNKIIDKRRYRYLKV